MQFKTTVDYMLRDFAFFYIPLSDSLFLLGPFLCLYIIPYIPHLVRLLEQHDFGPQFYIPYFFLSSPYFLPLHT